MSTAYAAPPVVRHATLADLQTLLTEQHARKVDAVVAAAAIRVKDGRLILKGTEPIIDENGVTLADGVYRPTDTAVGDLAEKLRIDTRHLRRLFAERPDLFDANINGLLRGKQVRRAGGNVDVLYPADDRRFLARCFAGWGGEGIVRAVLSDSYRPIDNLDVLFGALDGVMQAGVDVDIPEGGCDLTDRRMQVRIVAPGIQAYAPALLAGYRSPFADPEVYRVGSGGWTPSRALAAARAEGSEYKPGTEPVVFSGLRISNSETGDGRFTITPYLVFQICGNGLSMTADALSAVHLGGKLAEGVIDWGDDTRDLARQLVVKKTRDAVRKFLDPAFIARRINEIEGKAGARIENPADAITEISRDKRLAYTEAQQAVILDHFMRGGQFTAGGVMQAVTSAAQATDDPDAAMALEDSALIALDVAAKR